jgi:hypothetical protein
VKSLALLFDPFAPHPRRRAPHARRCIMSQATASHHEIWHTQMCAKGGRRSTVIAS